MKRIGIALGAARLVAVLPGGRRLETTETEDLACVFGELKRESGLPLARVSVALLPPLVDLRRVALPALRRDEYRRVIARDVARYFLGAHDPQIVSCDAPFAAAAPAYLIDAIERAVLEVGWRLDAVVPAHILWVSNVRDGTVIARLPHGVEHVRVELGKLVERSRLRGGTPAEAAVEIEPYDFAAAQACRLRRHPIELLSDARRGVRARVSRRLALVMSAAAVFCLLASATVDYWGLNRELARVRERRTTIAPALDRAMAARDSLAKVAGIVTTLASLDAITPTWAGFFTDLAEYLPREAHLDAFRAVGDSVSLVGVAQEAAAVFQGLERMPQLTAVRADGAIRQDVTAEGVVREHFGVSARWDGASGRGTP